MIANYRKEAIFFQTMEVNKALISQNKIQLKFEQCQLRFFKSEDDSNYFYCSFAIENFTDEEGYILELEFEDYIKISSIQSQQKEMEYNFNEEYLKSYSAYPNDMSFEQLLDNAIINFEERIQGGESHLLLTLKILGTTFYGYILIMDNMYSRENKQAKPISNKLEYAE